MNAEPIFTDLIGVMAVILMVPVIFLWLERRTRSIARLCRMRRIQAPSDPPAN